MQAVSRFKVAAVHASPVFMNKQASVDKAIGFIEESGRSGSSLLVFPEAFVPGYPYWGSCFPTMNQIPANAMFARASVEVPGPEIRRAKPLVSDRVIVEPIGATTTQTGLSVRCELDGKNHPKGIVVSDEQMQRLDIQRADFHGEWNYAIDPSIPPIKAIES